MTRKTAIFKNEVFLEHNPGYGHPESPDRLATIYTALEELGSHEYLCPAFEPASHDQLAKNHTPAHIARVAATAYASCILTQNFCTGSYAEKQGII